MNNLQAHYFAQESITLVNTARAIAGLPSLRENVTLSRAAQEYSRRMANENFYGHIDPQGRNVGDRIAAAGYLAQMSAENRAAGQPGPATAVKHWMESPGHRANIINPALVEIGAGYATVTTSPYFHYWTHVFATPDASVGRDHSTYPSLVVEEINKVRGQAGASPLRAHPVLESIARSQLPNLANRRAFRASANRTLNEASRATLKSFARALALTAAGAATPEAAVAQWTKEDGGRALADKALVAAGVAYVFVAQDDLRHYWLLVLGG